MLLRLFPLFQIMHTFIHFKNHQFTLILKTLQLYDQISPGQELQAPTHAHTHTQPAIMTYGRILYKNELHPRNSS